MPGKQRLYANGAKRNPQVKGWHRLPGRNIARQNIGHHPRGILADASPIEQRGYMPQDRNTAGCESHLITPPSCDQKRRGIMPDGIVWDLFSM
jgi:hypothetical protein